MQNRSIILSGAILLALGCGANAQELGDETQSVTELETLLVTDGLSPVAQEKSGRAFTVITGEALERNQVRHVADALRQVPGFSVSRMGARGALTKVRVRGAEANHILVLIDGVEVSETSTGEFDFSSLIVDEIDRIEILRGPQSAFLGSDALAGVVNIITRRGERGGWAASLRSEAGTDGTLLGGVTLRGGGENYDLALSGNFQRSDGFDVSGTGSEKDGDRNTTLNAKLTADLTPQLKLDGTLRFVDRMGETDWQNFAGIVEDSADWTKSRELFGSAGLTHESLDGAWTQRARFSFTDTHRENFNEFYFDPFSTADGGRLKASYQATYAFSTPSLGGAEHKITGGYEWERETYTASHVNDHFRRDIHGFIGEYRGEYLDQFYLNLGLRHDRNDRFADATTYSIAGAWRSPDRNTRLHASVGTGVTNPTFVEQFGWDPTQFTPNPDLIPEKSFGWDIGIERTFLDGMLIADLTWFDQDLTHEIYTDYDVYPFTVRNREGISRRRGIELSARLDLFNGLTAHATYTYLHSTEQTVAGGPELAELQRPRHSGALGIAYSFAEDRARIFADAIFNGEMPDLDFTTDPASRIRLPAYTVVNLGGSYRLNEQVEIYGRIENLFDSRYQEVHGYAAQGRTAFAGVKAKF